MKLSFWNIGRGQTSEKSTWAIELLTATTPDIIAFAEGPESIRDSHVFEQLITSLNYQCYYAPHYYDGPKINKQYDWNRCGLKVFYKNGFKLKSSFVLSNQKLEGRIIYIRCDNYSIFIVHGPSMAGDELTQASFVAELSRFISIKTMRNDKENIVVVGDFNLEPWDRLLRGRKHIESHFYSKSFKFHANYTNDKKIYWNPIFEYLQQEKNAELIGSFFKDKWIGLLDFALLSKNDFLQKIELPTSLNSKLLLTAKNGSCKLPNHLDHLPLILELK